MKKSREQQAVNYTLLFGFIVLIVGAVLILQDTADLRFAGLELPQENNNQDNPQQLDQVFQSAPTLGSSNADIVLIEFGDFECPFCKQVSPIIDKIQSEYTGKIQRVWVHTINQQAHPMAKSAAIASQCAHNQGKFWSFHDALFANQDNLSTALYSRLATNLDLDRQLFNACLTDPATSDLIDAHLAFSDSLNVTATPTISVNGTFYEGVFTESELKQLIEQAL